MKVSPVKIKRALVSVSDKTGIAAFAKELVALGVEILSTGGTAKLLAQESVKVRSVDDYTGFPEMMDGRVKTLHPKVHAGLLYIRDNQEHVAQKKRHQIEDIDMVVVNLYPFEATISKTDVTLEDAIENIDIGGPTMLRSAAKNHAYVTVVTDPTDYPRVLDEMKKAGGVVSPALRNELAYKVFSHTSAYDSMIADYLGKQYQGGDFPEVLRTQFVRVGTLRYGENPHQKAAFYHTRREPAEPSAAWSRVLGGKELSFNNYLDIEAALEIVKDFKEPAVCIIKHNNPCGAAAGKDLVEVYKKAYACDTVSAFGGIVAVNQKVTPELAEVMAGPNTFLECVVAPGYEPASLKILTEKPKWGKNVRLLECGELTGKRDGREIDVRKLLGGALVQNRDLVSADDFANLKVVTKKQPSDSQLADLKFVWVLAKHVKSNAIVFAKDRALVGVGAGQMSRVDSSTIAGFKAGDRAKGAVCASDAFFPFRDGVEAIARSGVTAIIQPGGSRADEDVIKCADELGLVMILTGRRHFRH
jgi:phosphoribosylaminoimidazolecarboxamide formyltransferase/IMP cyclohydrolase